MIAPSMRILGGQAIQAEYLRTQLEREPSLEVAFLAIDPKLPRALANIRFLRTVARFALYVPMVLGGAWRCDVLHIF